MFLCLFVDDIGRFTPGVEEMGGRWVCTPHPLRKGVCCAQYSSPLIHCSNSSEVACVCGYICLEDTHS